MLEFIVFFGMSDSSKKLLYFILRFLGFLGVWYELSDENIGKL